MVASSFCRGLFEQRHRVQVDKIVHSALSLVSCPPYEDKKAGPYITLSVLCRGRPAKILAVWLIYNPVFYCWGLRRCFPRGTTKIVFLILFLYDCLGAFPLKCGDFIGLVENHGSEIGQCRDDSISRNCWCNILSHLLWSRESLLFTSQSWKILLLQKRCRKCQDFTIQAQYS